MGCTFSNFTTSLSIQNYHLCGLIGEGGFAAVYKAIDRTNKSQVAIKLINIEQCCSRKHGSDILQNELNSLKLLSSHPFIGKLYFAFHDHVYCYLVLELLEGGDLRYYLTSQYHFTERMIAFLAGCIGSALHHIHTHGILHRDIKPENIIFDARGYPKLIDFGISYVCQDRTMTCTNCSGTRLYSAPEIFTPSHAHGPAADFWALGIVLYEMLYLGHPFQLHCPVEFIKFVGNYLNYKQSLVHKKETDNGMAILAESHHSQHPPESSKSDFGEPHEVGIREFDLKVLPEDLRVRLLPSNAYGDPLSPNCHDFLHNLLDVRPDHRFGDNEERYADFVRHDWLLSHDIYIPFLSNLEAHTQTTPPTVLFQQLSLLREKSMLAMSPIIIHRGALQFYLLKRFENSPKYPLPDLNNGSLLKFLKIKKICPEYPSHVTNILNSYQYSNPR